MKYLAFIPLFFFLYSCNGWGSHHSDTVVIIKHDTAYQYAPIEPAPTEQKHSYHGDGTLPDTGTALGDLQIYDVKYLPHLLDDGVTITGAVIDKNENKQYKDVVFEVFYYSKTETLIDTENFIQYEYFTPGNLVHFKLHGKDLDGIANVSVVIKSATPI